MTTPRWIAVPVARAVHDLLIERTGGTPGILSEGQLESTAARPQQLFAHEASKIHRLAACYAYGLVKNRCFIDGNRRTALSVLDIFLQLNGYRLSAYEIAAVTVMRAVAADEMSEDKLSQWIEDNTVAVP